jgi:hypothetical protein
VLKQVVHIVTTLFQVVTVAYIDTVGGHHSSCHHLDMSFSPVQSECSSHGTCILPKHRVLFACLSGSRSHVRDRVGAHSPRLQGHFLHVNISDITDCYYHCSSVDNQTFRPTQLSQTSIRLLCTYMFIGVYWCLLMFIGVYGCLLMFIDVYWYCKHNGMATNNYLLFLLPGAHTRGAAHLQPPKPRNRNLKTQNL